MIGQIISHYKILEKIGEGGMGVVYKALDTRLDRIVALKFLTKHHMSDEEARIRFETEAKSASALNHPNITTIYEIDKVKGECFISMEYIEGKTLKELIGQKNISTEQALTIAMQVGEGLKAAHQKGIIHRDIKSDNIMITGENLVKIMDFGLAKLRRVSNVTREGTTLGTIPYMSPEQIQGVEIDQRSDIFSFGVVLYEMITGQQPFKGGYEASVIYSIIHDKPEPLIRYKADLHEGLQQLMDKTLKKEKEDRYQDIKELITDLRAVQRQLQPAIKVQKKVTDRAIYFVGGFAILLLAVLGYLFLWQGPVTVSEKSIAVLPFTDMSPQQDQGYFCDGMTEELINRLSNVAGLKVPARTSVFTFKGKTAEIREVGEKLKVQTVLEGSVQKSGNQLRIRAQLINVADGYHIWSEKYDRELKEVFAIQDEISDAIVGALQLELTAAERKKISERPINDAGAYECYLKANYEIWRYQEEALDRASRDLQSALKITGDNPLLYAALAGVYFQYVNIGARQEEYLEQAESFARKALAMNPEFAKANAILGWMYLARNPKDAIGYFKRALAANPNEPDALLRLAFTYQDVGKLSAALPLLERLERTDPLNPGIYLAQGRHWAMQGQFSSALELASKLYHSDPASPSRAFSYAQVLIYNQKYDEAVLIIDTCARAHPNNALSQFGLLLKMGLQKDRTRAFQILTPELRQTCQRDGEWSYYIAQGFALLDEKQESLQWLENAINLGLINYPFINKYDTFLNNIRGEAGFRKLMERVKHEWENFVIED